MVTNPLAEWEQELLNVARVRTRRRPTTMYVCWACRYRVSSEKVQRIQTGSIGYGGYTCPKGHELQYDHGEAHKAPLPLDRDDHQGWKKASDVWGPTSKKVVRRRPRRGVKTRHEREVFKRLLAKKTKALKNSRSSR